MVQKSGTRRADRKKIGTDYLISSGYGIVYVRTDWMKQVERLKRFGKKRRKRSKIDKWRFK